MNIVTDFIRSKYRIIAGAVVSVLIWLAFNSVTSHYISVGRDQVIAEYALETVKQENSALSQAHDSILEAARSNRELTVMRLDAERRNRKLSARMNKKQRNIVKLLIDKEKNEEAIGILSEELGAKKEKIETLEDQFAAIEFSSLTCQEFREVVKDDKAILTFPIPYDQLRVLNDAARKTNKDDTLIGPPNISDGKGAEDTKVRD